MFSCGNAIYFGGGTTDSGKTALQTFVRYDILSNTTHQLKNLPFANAVGSIALKLNDSTVYLLGGCTTDACDSNIYVYNVPNDEWRILTRNIRPGRFGFAFLLDSAIYTGLQSHDEMHIFNDTYKLNLRTQKWALAKPFKGQSRTRVVCGVIDEHRAFVGLGTKLKVLNVYPRDISELKRGLQHKLSTSFFRDIYIYDDRTNKWSGLPILDKARRSALAFYLDGYLYVGMGNEENTVLRDFNRIRMKGIPL
jgi:N-acetylneuraminic acid mutarotase